MVSPADIRRREAPPAKSLPADQLRPLAVCSSVLPQLYRSCLLWRLAPRAGRSRITGSGRATAGETREYPALPRPARPDVPLSLIHISEPTRLGMISYAVFCL